MHYTEGSNNVAGMFTDGDGTYPESATKVDSDWLNTIQKELANVVLSAGLALKTKATETYTQLASCINLVREMNVGAAFFTPPLTGGVLYNAANNNGEYLTPATADNAYDQAMCDITPFLRPGMKLTAVALYGYTAAASGTVASFVSALTLSTGAVASTAGPTITAGDTYDSVDTDITIADGVTYCIYVQAKASSSITDAKCYGLRLFLAPE